MFYSLIAFLFVLAELAGGGVALSGILGKGDSARLFYHLFVYGSPSHLAMNFFEQGSGVFESSKYVLALMGFHVLKYGAFILAQLRDGPNGLLTAAIIGEALYLCGSAYLVF